MKKIITAVMLLLLTFSACSTNLTDKEDIIKVFEKNEETITEAVESGNFYDAEKIFGIYEVNVYDRYIEFQCGATGIVPSSTYYGFFYSPYNDPAAIFDEVYSSDDLTPEGEGFIWNEPDGDNEFYIEKIAENFFYYEMKF